MLPVVSPPRGVRSRRGDGLFPVVARNGLAKGNSEGVSEAAPTTNPKQGPVYPKKGRFRAGFNLNHPD